MYRFVLLVTLLTANFVSAEEKTREEKVREDRARVESDGFWIYNNLPVAFDMARQTGKPILVVLRCIPCEECVKLDDELVDQDPVVRPLLDQFVCVRQVSTNGLDLSLFQYDTDQSFAVFMLNADKTIYGRFGTRSHQTEWLDDVSLAGLAKALQGALELHRDYPRNKAALAAKTGKAWEFSTPSDYPSLKKNFSEKWDFKGAAVRSCIHCHQIGDARRDYYREAGKAIPEKILYPTPHPKDVGLILDPSERAKIKQVADRSPAESAGFQAGDEIVSLGGQPLLSIADVQWALESVDPDGASISAVVQRSGKTQELQLKLPAQWRRAGDLSWRVSSWGLRRMTTGGLLLESLPEEDRARLKIAEDAMALRVKHVGQYGKHAAAKRAGFRKDDVIVEFDGRTDLLRESDLLRHGVTERRSGDRVPVTVIRDGKRIKLRLPMQS